MVFDTDNKLSCFNGLIQAVSLAVRVVFADVTGDTLVYKVYFWRKPQDHEIQLLQDAARLAMEDFPAVRTVRVEAVFTREPFESLPKLDNWLFVRAEELDGYPDAIALRDEEMAL